MLLLYCGSRASFLAVLWNGHLWPAPMAPSQLILGVLIHVISKLFIAILQVRIHTPKWPLGIPSPQLTVATIASTWRLGGRGGKRDAAK